MNDAGDPSLPYSEACERNKAPILEVLREHLPVRGEVLEIGSGSGQHAVFFARQFPGLRWQPSDTGDFLPGLRARLAAEAPANLAAALELDVRSGPWSESRYAAVFSANTMHYMSSAAGRDMLYGCGRVLQPDGILIVYGPFKYNGEFTTPSNARFDGWLKSSDPQRGVRDFEWVKEVAGQAGLRFCADIAMPANNQCLIWRKNRPGD